MTGIARTKVVVICATEDDEAKYGRLPWPRRRYAEIARCLAKGRARAIIFDGHFPNDADHDDDRALAEAISRAGMVILP